MSKAVDSGEIISGTRFDYPEFYGIKTDADGNYLWDVNKENQ